MQLKSLGETDLAGWHILRLGVHLTAWHWDAGHGPALLVWHPLQLSGLCDVLACESGAWPPSQVRSLWLLTAFTMTLNESQAFQFCH